MRIPPPTIPPQPTDTNTDTNPHPPIDPLLRVRILIETAMEQAQFAGTDPDLIARQLAAELCKHQAKLSDVRVAVQELYQGDRAGAQAYLAYLAQHGFPKAAPDTQPQVTTGRTLAEQTQAISQYQPDAYGQIAAVQTNAQAPVDSARIPFYSGNLIAELVANSAFSAVVCGERRSGTSALLRAIAYDQIAKSAHTILDILDLHDGTWGGLEDIQLPDGARIVSYQRLSTQLDIEALSQKLVTLAAEVRRRQRQQQQNPPLTLSANKSPPPYLFLIDGLSEIHGVLPGWSADRRSKDAAFSRAASSLRVVLCHGPAVGISCVATARDHSTCLCDAIALAETRLLFLGRVSSGRNGGYRAIDRAIEDKELLPAPHERSRFREALALVKQLAQPVVFTPNGIPRLGSLGDFGGYLSADLLIHYQQALEAQA